MRLIRKSVLMVGCSSSREGLKLLASFEMIEWLAGGEMEAVKGDPDSS